MFAAMMDKPGFYVLDEPESALSFTACLHLFALMTDLGRTGSQVVCATPGADIIEVRPHGLRRTRWAELQVVDHWRRFLITPDSYLRHFPHDDQPED